MAIATELKKTLTDTTPLYAVAGAGDLMVEKLRELPEKLRVEITTDPKVLRERFQTLPDRTQTFAKSQVDKAKELYEDLAARGEKLVKRVDRQESTKRAKSAVNTTESKAKATTTAAKRGVANAKAQAKATATAAGKTADAAADAIEQGAKKIGDSAAKPTPGAGA
ncbi:hypothetical protein [Embleya sp. NBC_00896]|uniref:hypothetical protein n=1 Tax=Embleya sp. NBC_00896 TaxID=2975961 RepID=UPI00386ED76B|nr:hypothetical protein OG928_15065 [Embleya sp. NBC_00896]